MQVILTAVGPDNRGLADPIVHHVTTAGANIFEIQMYDHDSEGLFAMLLRIDWPAEAGSIADLRKRMHEIGVEKGLSVRTWSRDGITLRVSERLRFDVVLELGDLRQEITITDAASGLRTDSAELSEHIANQRVTNLPLNGRRFSDLTLLSDNVVAEPRGTRGAALGQTGPTVAVAGQRGGHNMYFLDGASVTDQYFNNLAVSPSVDSIQEFTIQKSIYAAEYGGKASATISAATKSGSNEFHGSGYEFVRNSAFDARNYFNARKPPLRQNQFGGTLGGPLRLDRTFFFTSASATVDTSTPSRERPLPKLV